MKDLKKTVLQTNQLVRSQIRKSDEALIEEAIERNKKTRIVRKPKDVNIRNSKNLRTKFCELYPNILLRQARISASESFVLEFDDDESVKHVEDTWDVAHFEGNSGLVKIDEHKSTGLVKFVYNQDEEEVIADIEEKYPDVKYELFKKEDAFTGMIKVTFNNEEELKAAITNKFQICGTNYIIENFIHKPRVIICKICLRFGHICRLCRSKDKPICGKCSKEGHESKNCDASPEDYKCYHCNQSDHITGSAKCEKVIEKYQELINRANNG